MQAVIICGGKGTRLRPLSDGLAKSLVPVKGVPLLEYQLRHLELLGFDDIILATGHLGEQIEAYISQRRSKARVRISHEKTELGTAGAVLNIQRGWLEDIFLVQYGDVISLFDYRKTFSALADSNAEAAIVLREREGRGSSLVLTEAGMVTRFIERPDGQSYHDLMAEGYRNLVNSGVFALKKSSLSSHLSVKLDFSYDIFPGLLKDGKGITWCLLDSPWWEIGTLERLKAFEKDIDSFKI